MASGDAPGGRLRVAALHAPPYSSPGLVRGGPRWKLQSSWIASAEFWLFEQPSGPSTRNLCASGEQGPEFKKYRRVSVVVEGEAATPRIH